MPNLEVTLKPAQEREPAPGEVSLEATFTNAGAEPARLNVHQAGHPALVLHVQDEKGERVLLPPPSAPDEADLAPGDAIGPGASVTITYAGFLDSGLPAGTYRIRYFGQYEALGGTRDDPLLSEFVDVRTRPVDLPVPIRLPRPKPRVAIFASIFDLIGRWYHWLICLIRRLVLRKQCDRVLDGDVDEYRTETITNAPPGSEAWNNTYGWRARFHVRVDEAACRVTVTVRVRLAGTITAAQRSAWETAIQNVWSNRFKLCCRCCCCSNGYTIVADIEFVTSGEHQVVNVGASTTNMGNWGAADTIDISHEFGHMLGALDEYFTVNGVNYGAGRQPGGNIMNNPANPPVAQHYDLVRSASGALLGTSCSTKSVNDPC